MSAPGERAAHQEERCARGHVEHALRERAVVVTGACGMVGLVRGHATHSCLMFRAAWFGTSANGCGVIQPGLGPVDQPSCQLRRITSSVTLQLDVQV